MRRISVEALDDIALGAAVLGTGGGGDPYIGKLMAQGRSADAGRSTLIDPMELDDDDLVVPSAMMGAPTVMVEKIPRGDEIVTAFKALETYLGRPVRATMSSEAGGLNSTTPFTVAAELGIPAGRCRHDGPRLPRAPDVHADALRRHRDTDGDRRREGQFGCHQYDQQPLDRNVGADADGRHGLLGDDRHLPDDRQAGQRDLRAQHDHAH